ncbi:MAG: YfhO family protein [Bacilli bacterium]
MDISIIKDRMYLGLSNTGKFFSDLGKKIFRFFRHPGEATKTCYLLLICGFLGFILTWADHYATVPMGGDYTLQMMTFPYKFYDDWHEFFRTGVFPAWDWSVFLGIDNVGGNAFYCMFSPFTLLSLLFPRSWLLALQGLGIPLKMTLAGMLFYWYLSEFELSPKIKRVGALSYGFCGWIFSYLWFHFINSFPFLPLVFLGVERLLKKRDPKILMVGYLLSAMTNYFFFVEFMFGGFFYWVFRYFQTLKTRTKDGNWAVLGVSFIGFLVSVMLGCFTLLPGISMALGMPRVTNATSEGYFKELLAAIKEGFSPAWKALFNYEGNNQAAFTPMMNFLFEPFGCFYSNIIPVSWYDNYSASLYANAPFLLFFFVAVFESIRKKKISHLIAIALNLFTILTPFGYYIYNGGVAGYARFYLMPLCWMITYVCLTLSKRKEIPSVELDLSAITVLILDLCSFFVAVSFHNNFPNYQNDTDWDTRLFIIMGTMIWVLVCFLAMRPLFHKKGFSIILTSLVGIEVVFMANATVFGQGVIDIETMGGGPQNIAEETEIVKDIKEGEGGEDYYRIMNTSQDRGNINLNQREGYNGLGDFHSVYAFQTQDFLNASRIPYSSGNWSMGVHNRRENLETFLSTKYYLVPKVDLSYKPYQIPFKDYDIPYGYKNILSLTEEEKEAYGVSYSQSFLDFLASDSCNKSVYLNLDFIDTFFSFDNIIDSVWTSSDYLGTEFTGNYEDFNEYPLLRSAILYEEDYEEFKDEFNPYNTISYNGKTTTISGTTVTTKRALFQSGISTDSVYQEGKTAPIEAFRNSSTVKSTIYSANWYHEVEGSTEGGQYVYGYSPKDGHAIVSTGDEDYSSVVTEDWISKNPLLYANGIYPGDTAFDFNTGKKQDGSYVTEKGVLYNSKIVMTFQRNGEDVCLAPEADPSDPETGAYISINTTYNVSWRLFDEQGKLISIFQPSYCDYKRAHGLYTDRPVKTIVGVIYDGHENNLAYLGQPQVFVQRNKDYQKAVDELKAHSPKITARTNNSISFTTDETSSRFMATNIPAEKGWKLQQKTNTGKMVDVDTYKVQHGFVGFVVPEGMNEFVLSYTSPMTAEGFLISLLGGMILLLFAAVDRTGKRKYGREDMLSLRPIMDKEIRLEKYKEEDE